jgi:hypothetical protein
VVRQQQTVAGQNLKSGFGDFAGNLVEGVLRLSGGSRRAVRHHDAFRAGRREKQPQSLYSHYYWTRRIIAKA